MVCKRTSSRISYNIFDFLIALLNRSRILIYENFKLVILSDSFI